MRVKRLDGTHGFVDLVADVTYVQVQTEAGLLVSIVERVSENGLGITIDSQTGRLDIGGVYATDSQARLKVATVNAPAGATIARLTQNLLGIEWVVRLRDDGTTYHQCPACGRLDYELHTPGCWLGAFLGQPTSFNPAKPGDQA